MLKLILKILGGTLGGIALLLIGLILFLSVTEFKPADRESVTNYKIEENAPMLQEGQTVTVYSWNIGYAGLGKDSDFFMDGGKMTDPPSQEAVEENMAAIQEYIGSQTADAWLLQEVDVNSARTEKMDQFALLQEAWNGSSGFAYNYKCPFVPIPLPPLGQIESGIATLTAGATAEEMERVSLPCPFSWPVRVAQIKRCLMITRMPIEGSDKELVLVNLHLEAYDDGEGKKAQTEILLQVLQAEYEKGNYVIAGGDFNQSFPGVLEQYPIQDPQKWTPGILEDGTLPEGWQFAYDLSAPTCRLLDQPYNAACQLYVIDGFILSPNVQLNAVQTQDLDFQNSDHNPVRLEVTLVP